VKIAPEAIDPDDPETLEDLVVAAVNNALDAAQALAESRMGGMMPDIGGLGLPGF
jgi:DNA-binding protein YbaB